MAIGSLCECKWTRKYEGTITAFPDDYVGYWVFQPKLNNFINDGFQNQLGPRFDHSGFKKYWRIKTKGAGDFDFSIKITDCFGCVQDFNEDDQFLEVKYNINRIGCGQGLPLVQSESELRNRISNPIGSEVWVAPGQEVPPVGFQEGYACSPEDAPDPPLWMEYPYVNLNAGNGNGGGPPSNWAADPTLAGLPPNAMGYQPGTQIPNPPFGVGGNILFTPHWVPWAHPQMAVSPFPGTPEEQVAAATAGMIADLLDPTKQALNIRFLWTERINCRECKKEQKPRRIETGLDDPLPPELIVENPCKKDEYGRPSVACKECELEGSYSKEIYKAPWRDGDNKPLPPRDRNDLLALFHGLVNAQDILKTYPPAYILNNNIPPAITFSELGSEHNTVIRVAGHNPPAGETYYGNWLHASDPIIELLKEIPGRDGCGFKKFKMLLSDGNPTIPCDSRAGTTHTGGNQPGPHDKSIENYCKRASTGEPYSNL